MQTVYVPVKYEETKPEESDRYGIILKSEICIDSGFYNGHLFLDVPKPEYWLKPTEAVLLTKEDTEKIKSLIQKQINRCSHVDLMLTNTIAEDLEQALTILNKNL